MKSAEYQDLSGNPISIRRMELQSIKKFHRQILIIAHVPYGTFSHDPAQISLDETACHNLISVTSWLPASQHSFIVDPSVTAARGHYYWLISVGWHTVRNASFSHCALPEKIAQFTFYSFISIFSLV